MSQEDPLSCDNNVCNILEKYADYLLYAPDVKEKNYVQAQTSKRQTNNTAPLEARSEVPALPEGNYYLEPKEAVTGKDLRDPELKEVLLPYQKLIDAFRTKQRLFAEALERQYRNGTPMPPSLRGKSYPYFVKQIGLLKQDMLDLKAMIKRPFRGSKAKSVQADIQWSECDYANVDHMRELLRLPPCNMSSDLGLIAYDIQQLVSRTNLSDKETTVLQMLRGGFSQSEIAAHMGVNRSTISMALNKIVQKVVTTYEEEWYDWYFLNCERGEYDTCSSCGQIFLKKFLTSRKNRNFCSTCRKN